MTGQRDGRHRRAHYYEWATLLNLTLDPNCLGGARYPQKTRLGFLLPADTRRHVLKFRKGVSFRSEVSTKSVLTRDR